MNRGSWWATVHGVTRVGHKLVTKPPHTNTHTHTHTHTHTEASLVAQTVKNLPAMEETQAQSLSQEDPLEKGMAIYFSILAWRIPCTEKPDGLQSMASQRVRYNCKS